MDGIININPADICFIFACVACARAFAKCIYPNLVALRWAAEKRKALS